MNPEAKKADAPRTPAPRKSITIGNLIVWAGLGLLGVYTYRELAGLRKKSQKGRANQHAIAVKPVPPAGDTESRGAHPSQRATAGASN